jgi:hypothetical protein
LIKKFVIIGDKVLFAGARNPMLRLLQGYGAYMLL